MTRKAAARGRKAAARSTNKTASRATTRTGKKTASARASHAPAVAARRGTPARKAGVGAPEHEVKIGESRIDQVRGANAEDDEDLDWLNEDEDPRSQIVEGDDDMESHQQEEW